jgi:aerobic carbon-monoxide dehydrogenase large subunit
MTTKLFGERVKRAEDPRLVTGNGRYLDDLGHDALEVAFVRSPHAHARVLDIDVSDALDVDGLVAVYTYDDLAEDTGSRVAEPLPLLIPHPTLTHGRTQYALAKDEVNYVGEAIVMVVATSRYVAEDAVSRITVDYEFLPAVVGIEAARSAEHLVHEDVPGNVAAVMVQQTGDADAAIDAAPHRLELELAIERSASTPMEGKGVLARWDADDRSLRVHTSTQSSTSVRQAVAAKLALPVDRVDVIAPDIGGGFGVKIVHPWPEEVLVPWAAVRLDRPVKWTEDRREHFISAAHERGQLHEVRVGYDDDGKLLGLSVRFWHDHGAYIPYGLIVPIITSTQLLGPYKPGVYRVEFASLYTNTVIVTPYRGAGRPQGCFVMERVMDAIAAERGIDRTVVRERNFIQPDEMPYDQGLIFQDGRQLLYDSGDYPASMEKLKKLVGWDDFESFRELARAEGRRVGIGLACYVEGTGVGPYEGGHVRVETDGSVVVSTGLTTQGQGHQTMLAQIVADELGVPFERIAVTTGDTRRFKYAVGTFASRTAVMSGSAVAMTARKVREKALTIAAQALEASADDLEIVDGVVRVKGSPSAQIDLGAVAVLSNPLRYAFDEAAQRATQFAAPADPDKPPVEPGVAPGLEGTDYYSPTRSTFANGMHAVVVETDPDTAEVKILRYCVVHDCGTLINPMIVEGQIHGGVAQGVGGALYERMEYAADGQLLNASFMDFLMPYASEVPEIEIDHLVTPSPLNPLGVKGAGEAGVIPGSAAIASAIEDAEGVAIRRMPISPSELFDLRRQHSGDLDETTTKDSR